MSNFNIKNLSSDIYESTEEANQIVLSHPDYFNLDYCNKLPKLIEELDLEINNFWYKIFIIKLIKKIRNLKLNNYKGKVLILNNVTGEYGESLLYFLSYFNKEFEIIDLGYSTHCLNIYNKIKSDLESKNKNIKIKLCPKADYNKYDLIIAVGPSKLLLSLLENSKINPKLVFIDLSVFHGIREFDNGQGGQKILPNIKKQKKSLYVYSCQKINFFYRYDGIFNPDKLKMKYFTYIPAYFKKFPIINSNNFLFDIIILSKNQRDFSIIKKLYRFLKNKNILFLGGNSYSEEIFELKKFLPHLKVVPRVKHNFYVKLLDLSKIIWIPMRDNSMAVVLSITDALAAGKAIITSQTPGIIPLIEKNTKLPLVVIRNSDINNFKKEIDQLLDNESYRKKYEQRALKYARKKLNLDKIFYNIFKDIEENLLYLN